MITTNQIIEEALKFRMEEEMYSKERETTVGKLLSNPFLPFRKNREKGQEASIILYLSERLASEVNKTHEALQKEYNAHRKAKKCVEIYGIEAELLLEKMWNDKRFI